MINKQFVQSGIRYNISQILTERSGLYFGAVIVIAVASCLVRQILDRAGVVPFNSDEAIVALMAKHILAGELPVFFYGQAYMGSLDAFLIAAGFAIFGQEVWVIRLVQGILYALNIIATMRIAEEISQSRIAGLLTGIFLLFPPVNVILYTTASLGGYGEAVLIGSISVLLALEIYSKYLIDRLDLGFGFYSRILAVGFLTGFGLWANALSLVFTFPAWLLIFHGFKKFRPELRIIGSSLLLAAFGLMVGSLPWWYYALTSGWQSLISELFGSAVAVETVGFWQRTLNHLVSLTLLGGSVTLGLRPPWSVDWLVFPLIPVVLVFWSLVIRDAVVSAKHNPEKIPISLMLAGIGVVLFGGFIFTSFGVDPSGRYFLPLIVPMSVSAGWWVSRANHRQLAFRAGCFVLILFFQAAGVAQSILKNPPGLTTQFYHLTAIDHRYDEELIDFLMGEGEKYIYSNYWVSYPIVFKSDEQLILTPRLPYHTDLRYTSRDDRYPLYTRAVSSSDHPAFITTRNQNLDDFLRDKFRAKNLSWKENQIGDFRIFYDLSGAIHPDFIFNPIETKRD